MVRIPWTKPKQVLGMLQDTVKNELKFDLKNVPRGRKKQERDNKMNTIQPRVADMRIKILLLPATMKG